MSNLMAIDVYQWLREVCISKLLQMTIKLGGTGKVVQIDESLFRHKPKVNHAGHTTFYTYTLHQYIYDSAHISIHCSITEAEQQPKRSGFLEW